MDQTSRNCSSQQASASCLNFMIASRFVAKSLTGLLFLATCFKDVSHCTSPKSFCQSGLQNPSWPVLSMLETKRWFTLLTTSNAYMLQCHKKINAFKCNGHKTCFSNCTFNIPLSHLSFILLFNVLQYWFVEVIPLTDRLSTHAPEFQSAAAQRAAWLFAWACNHSWSLLGNSLCQHVSTICQEGKFKRWALHVYLEPDSLEHSFKKSAPSPRMHLAQTGKFFCLAWKSHNSISHMFWRMAINFPLKSCTGTSLLVCSPWRMGTNMLTPHQVLPLLPYHPVASINVFDPRLAACSVQCCLRCFDATCFASRAHFCAHKSCGQKGERLFSWYLPGCQLISCQNESIYVALRGHVIVLLKITGSSFLRWLPNRCRETKATPPIPTILSNVCQWQAKFERHFLSLPPSWPLIKALALLHEAAYWCNNDPISERGCVFKRLIGAVFHSLQLTFPPVKIPAVKLPNHDSNSLKNWKGHF